MIWKEAHHRLEVRPSCIEFIVLEQPSNDIGWLLDDDRFTEYDLEQRTPIKQLF